MNNSINYEDLFNWQLESDRHYLSLLQNQKEMEYEWQQHEEKRLPAIVKIIKKERYEATTDTWEISRNSKKKL